MDRDIDSAEDVDMAGHNWRKIRNKALPDMYILGRSKVKQIPQQHQRQIRRALQNMTNLRLGNIALQGYMRVFNRLYIHGTVFHSAEVLHFNSFQSFSGFFRVFQSFSEFFRVFQSFQN